MAESVSSSISRRSALVAGGVAMTSVMAAARPQPGSPESLGSQPRPARPDRPPERAPSRASPASSAPAKSAGQPVSQTAAAQKGEPKVPGPPPPKARFALVGLGKLMVEEILPALKLTSRCEVSALVTGDPDKGRAVADQLGLAHDRVFGYADIPAFERDDAIDAVYIATPNALHARDAVAALRARKHVLCEKPMTTTLSDADAMIEAARTADRRLMVAYRVHHEPLNGRIREMVREQRYGKPHFVAFDTVMDVGPKPQPRLSKELGGGSLLDIGIYALNTTRWLLGEEPIEINAMQRASDDPRFDEVEGSIAFQLRFPSGCIANCTSSFGTARVNRYRIICEKGWLGMEPATSYRGLRGKHGDDESTIELKQPESVNQFAAELDHFAKVIQDGGEVATPGEEGRRDLALMLKIYEAAATGKTIKL